MKNIENFVSSLVSSQFPSFYKEEGPVFVEFVKAYYKWMEETDNPLYHSRNLLDYKDIDKTIDDFIIHFKETYVKDLPFTSVADQRLLIKNILDLYNNKGNERSVKLAIRALFNEDSNVYYPSVDVFKLSDGRWYKPTYLEVTASPRNNSFKNREIVGTSSGARAYCEGVVQKRISGKVYDVMYLSNVRGDFSYGEQVVELANTNTTNAPTIRGSLTKLNVISGGQGFQVGDEFKVVSDNGKQGKALVTSTSSETGRVRFELQDGGWGFSLNANVYISDKVLGYNNLTNANNLIDEFQLFEEVSQTLTGINFTSVVNAQYFTINTRVVSSNSTANVYAGIVYSDIANGSSGFIKISDINGNIVSTNSVFAADLVNINFTTGFNANSFSNAQVVEAINSSSTANAVIIGATASNSSAGVLLLKPLSGNLYSTNTIFRLVSNNSILANATSYTSNLSFTGIIADSDDSSANGTLIGQNQLFIGLDSVQGSFHTNSIFSFITGASSNCYANLSFVSTGYEAGFEIGSLDYEETVFLTPDLLGANNTGNVPFINVNLDLSPNNANASGYGFIKFPGADKDTILLDALRFIPTKIGTVSSITAINPGVDYNASPFVLIYERDVAGYGKRDYIITVSSATKSYTVGEIVRQTQNVAAVQLVINNFSGVAANGTVTTTFVPNEFVWQSNGTANIATGYVYSGGVSGGSGTVKLSNVSGSFQLTSLNGYQLQTLSSGASANITSVDNTATITVTAFGQVKAGSNTTLLKIKRLSFENTFSVGNNIIGRSSGACSTIQQIVTDYSVLPIGMNANVASTVQVAEDVVTEVKVIDSGFGYLDGENVTLENEDSNYVVTAQTESIKQGEGEGYYTTTGGFLSNDKKLYDGDYYQEYSYEIQTKVPFSKYSDILKKLVHVAGTKMFGKVELIATVNTQVTISNVVNKHIDLNFTSSSNNSFEQDELVVFSNGNSNSTIQYIEGTSELSSAISNNQNCFVLQVPDSNNSFVVGREVFSPNSSSYSVYGTLVAKSSNSTANITLLYVANVPGNNFTSSNTISGYISSNTSNTQTATSNLVHAVEVFGYGNVHDETISKILVPVANTLSSNIASGNVSISSGNLFINTVSTALGNSSTSPFSNNDYIYFSNGTFTSINIIDTIVTTGSSRYIKLKTYPMFSCTSVAVAKSTPLLTGYTVASPNLSVNTASGNVKATECNTTIFTHYLDNVYGSFSTGSNTVEGYTNTSSTNTYVTTAAINTLVVANTKNDIPTNSIVVGVSSNATANVYHVNVRLEK